MMSFPFVLAEAAGDVVLGRLLLRTGEDVGRGTGLDQFAEVEEGRVVGDAGGLLHGVSDDDDRVVVLELLNELLDAGGRDRVKGRARLVEQKDLGLDGNAAGDAKALLLGVNLGGLGTPIASLASLISYQFYSKAAHSRLGKYLGIFSAVNFGLLAVLLAVGWLQLRFF